MFGKKEEKMDKNLFEKNVKYLINTSVGRWIMEVIAEDDDKIVCKTEDQLTPLLTIKKSCIASYGKTYGVQVPVEKPVEVIKG